MLMNDLCLANGLCPVNSLCSKDSLCPENSLFSEDSLCLVNSLCSEDSLGPIDPAKTRQIQMEDAGQLILEDGFHLVQETTKRNRFDLESSGALIVEDFQTDSIVKENYFFRYLWVSP